MLGYPLIIEMWVVDWLSVCERHSPLNLRAKLQAKERILWSDSDSKFFCFLATSFSSLLFWGPVPTVVWLWFKDERFILRASQKTPFKSVYPLTPEIDSESLRLPSLILIRLLLLAEHAEGVSNISASAVVDAVTKDGFEPQNSLGWSSRELLQLGASLLAIVL